jgi:hypothetical protein
MSKARARVQNPQLVRDDAGPSTVEYLIVLVLFAAIAMGAWQTFGRTGSADRSNNAGVTSADSNQSVSKP